MPVQYLNLKNIFLNKINNVKKIISFIQKRLNRDLLMSNKFIFVLKVFSLRIEEIKFKTQFVEFK